MQKVYSVSQINTYIKNMFTQDFVLNRISIRGEVSNCKYHSSGHIYFSLKDASGTIACVMFAGARAGLAFRLSDGQQVVADGNVNVYERDGKYQLYVNRIRLDGAGVLYERFLAFKQELEEMGMFDEQYKKPIPPYVRKIGIVTAPTGAAVRDIINISRRRNPGISLILYPAKVQGEGAAESVTRGLEKLDALGLDVLIVGRGGGSIEDLWAFNEETVARAIFSCQTPVISAVGHETDTTIADFVADLRAPTPSAAAELAVSDVRMIVERIETQRLQMIRILNYRLHLYQQRLERYREQLAFKSPMQRVREQKLRTAELEEAFQRMMEQRLTDKKYRMSVYVERMKGLSPLNKLAHGYAAVTDEKGKRVHSIDQTGEGDMLSIYVSDGCIRALVKETEALTFEEEVQ
ncbi:MAG: exodeoxyribonuclease VII large subunit [Lachnospiraceae bacterium]|nr:exodeoxyribonuclease VII large subunit [Lachnospiraceae bacterium]